jgi:aspartate carbamoyltransferase catalytic subunit
MVFRDLVRLAQGYDEGDSPSPLDARTASFLCWTKAEKLTLGMLDHRIAEDFQTAAKRLGLQSSVAYPDRSENPGEAVASVRAIVKSSGVNLDGIVVRHSAAGVPAQIARLPLVSADSIFVVNAGDGANESPLLALGQILALLQLNALNTNTKCLITGDLIHEGIARSLARLGIVPSRG